MEEKKKMPGWVKLLIVLGVMFSVAIIALIVIVFVFVFKAYQPREEVSVAQIETFFNEINADYEILNTDTYSQIEAEEITMWVFDEDNENEVYDKIVEWSDENLGEFWGFFSGSAHQNGKNYEVTREFDFGGDGICLVEVNDQLIYIITSGEEGMTMQKEFLKEFNFSFFPKKEK